MTENQTAPADFADDLGPGYLNLVVRRVSQQIASAGDAYMRQTGVATAATSTAILAYVARHDNTAIADIAQALGYSHQAVRGRRLSSMEEIRAHANRREQGRPQEETGRSDPRWPQGR